MKKIAIFASGEGTNAENIYKFFSHGNRVKVDLVVTDRKDAGVIERMQAYGVETLYFPKSELKTRPEELIVILKSRHIDMIVLAGFLSILPEKIISAFRGRILNIHPSLLPAYGGKGMYGSRVHEAVIAAGETKSGVTVHYVSEEIDGGKILVQEEVGITPEDTPLSLEEKIHNIEYNLYPRAIILALRKLAYQPKIAQVGTEAETVMETEVETEVKAYANEMPETQEAKERDPEATEIPTRGATPPPIPSPAEEWAETLGVKYDPDKLPTPPPIHHGSGNENRRAYGAPNNTGDDLPPMPQNYLVWSVVMTVLCCLPAGIAAIIFSTQVNSKYYAGDYEGARKASERAQIWIIVSFVLGVLANTLYLPIMLISA